MCTSRKRGSTACAYHHLHDECSEGANAKYLQELEEEKKKKRKAQEEAEDQGEDRGIVPAAGEDGQADGNVKTISLFQICKGLL